MLNGEEQVAQVPISAGDWNGISRQRRAEMVQALEDSLLLGVPYEAMCGALQTEAQALRAQLATVRVVEGELQPLRVVTSSVPDLPVGTLVRSSPGTGSNT